MARLRMFLACLLLVALPLQGFAAASMLFCGPGNRAAAAAGEAHDHGHHGGAAAHAHEGHQHDEASAEAGAAQDGTSLPDPGQKCSICAACCHSAAVSETPRVPTPSPAPQGVASEQPQAVHDRPSPVPDKPPRA